jgi:CheY-specific phosphatase CheX
MCSPISPPIADYHEALLAAVTGVAENSLFAFVDASDQATFEAATIAPGADGGNDWLSAGIDFKGPIAGRFELTLSEALARHLCASFAGAETADEIGESDLLDFTGELANMMCGAWLTRAARHDAFSLMPPQVMRGRPGLATAGSESPERFYLSIDDAAIRLDLYWISTVPPAPEPADAP